MVDINDVKNVLQVFQYNHNNNMKPPTPSALIQNPSLPTITTFNHTRNILLFAAFCESQGAPLCQFKNNNLSLQNATNSLGVKFSLITAKGNEIKNQHGIELPQPNLYVPDWKSLLGTVSYPPKFLVNKASNFQPNPQAGQQSQHQSNQTQHQLQQQMQLFYQQMQQQQIAFLQNRAAQNPMMQSINGNRMNMNVIGGMVGNSSNIANMQGFNANTGNLINGNTLGSVQMV